MIAARLTQRNIDEAAKAVGISPNTLLNWMEVPEFQVAYREARRAAAATTLLKVISTRAPGLREGSRRRMRDESFVQDD